MSEYYVEVKKENIKFAGKTEEEKKLNEMIYDLTLENDALYEENKRLRSFIENNSKIGVADHKYASMMEDKYLELQQENEEFKNILTEFEKWLEERLDMTCGTDYNIYTHCLDKLQELKEGKE